MNPCVHYGCGDMAPEGWVNFDGSPTVRVERLLRRPRVFPANVRYGDIIRGLPVADSSCDFVYCSHILEHLALDDMRAALRNTLRILRPGGTFRLVVPDLETAVRRYLADPSDSACRHLMEDAHLGLNARAKGVRSILSAVFGATCHLWIWDFKALRAELANAGFADIRRASFGDNPDPAFRAVELEERWTESLGMECKRPG